MRADVTVELHPSHLRPLRNIINAAKNAMRPGCRDANLLREIEFRLTSAINVHESAVRAADAPNPSVSIVGESQ